MQAAAALGATPQSLALSGIAVPSAAAVPKDARNEFIFAYGHGNTSLPWGSKFGDRIAADDDRDVDPQASTLPTAPAAAAGAGAGVGASLVRVYMNADAQTRNEVRRAGLGTKAQQAALAAQQLAALRRPADAFAPAGNGWVWFS